MQIKLCCSQARKIIIRLLLFLVACGVAHVHVFSWGDEGHKVVAKLAEHYLTDSARQRILQLLRDDQKKEFYARDCPQAQSALDFMICVSSWADKVRNDRPETYNWHFVDIPNSPGQGSGPGFDASRDCPCTRDGDCIVRAIEQFRVMLSRKDDKGDREHQRRIEALKFIIHFVGDLHQPLHNSDNNDHGGNDVKVFWLGREFLNPEKKYEWNLHSVWDTGIIEHANPNMDEMASRLLAALATKDIKDLQKGSVIDWSNEAHKLAVNSAYDAKFLSTTIKGDAGKTKVDLREDYYNAQKGIVDDQLEKAGVRLARVLNEALGY